MDETYNGNNASLMSRINHITLSIGLKADSTQIATGCIDATHDTLIVTLEEDGDEGECLYSEVELTRRKPLPESGVAHGRIVK